MSACLTSSGEKNFCGSVPSNIFVFQNNQNDHFANKTRPEELNSVFKKYIEILKIVTKSVNIKGSQKITFMISLLIIQRNEYC